MSASNTNPPCAFACLVLITPHDIPCVALALACEIPLVTLDERLGRQPAD